VENKFFDEVLLAMLERKNDVRYGTTEDGYNALLIAARLQLELERKYDKKAKARPFRVEDFREDGKMKAAIGMCLERGELLTIDFKSGSPHILGIGSTGSGKSVWVICLLLWMMAEYSEEELRIWHFDNKMGETTRHMRKFNFPHYEVTTDRIEDAYNMLKRLEKEVERRQLETDKSNQPFILCIIDEFKYLKGFEDEKDFVATLDRLVGVARSARVGLVMVSQYHTDVPKSIRENCDDQIRMIHNGRGKLDNLDYDKIEFQTPLPPPEYIPPK
jgi:hypothetical protein